MTQASHDGARASDVRPPDVAPEDRDQTPPFEEWQGSWCNVGIYDHGAFGTQEVYEEACAEFRIPREQVVALRKSIRRARNVYLSFRAQESEIEAARPGGENHKQVAKELADLRSAARAMEAAVNRLSPYARHLFENRMCIASLNREDAFDAGFKLIFDGEHIRLLRAEVEVAVSSLLEDGEFVRKPGSESRPSPVAHRGPSGPKRRLSVEAFIRAMSDEWELLTGTRASFTVVEGQEHGSFAAFARYFLGKIDPEIENDDRSFRTQIGNVIKHRTAQSEFVPVIFV